MRTQRKDSKASDIHGVICETTKHATSTVGTCKFDFPHGYPTYGSFSFKRNESDKESKIKCFQQVKPGFEVKIYISRWDHIADFFQMLLMAL